MKSRAVSNSALCFLEPIQRAFSCPSTFVLGKPAQVRYAEAGEFFGIAFSRFTPPVQIALQQAAAAVLCIDVGMRRPLHRPGCLCRPSHRHFVNHSRSGDCLQSVPTQHDGESCQFFPKRRP